MATESELQAAAKELRELQARQLVEDGFAGAAPGNSRPKTPEERDTRLADIRQQVAALRERDAVAAVDRAKKAAAAKEG